MESKNAKNARQYCVDSYKIDSKKKENDLKLPSGRFGLRFAQPQRR